MEESAKPANKVANSNRRVIEDLHFVTRRIAERADARSLGGSWNPFTVSCSRAVNGVCAVWRFGQIVEELFQAARLLNDVK